MHFTKQRVGSVKRYVEGIVTGAQVPGAVVLLGEGGDICLEAAYGLRASLPQEEAMTLDTIFDLASVSKVMATWPVILGMMEQGLLSLTDTLSDLFPYPVHEDLAGVTLEQILVHCSGLPERTWIRQYGVGMEQAVRGILSARASYVPGSEVRYCSRGPILLGHLVELRLGMSLSEAARRFWKEMGMADTYASPVPEAVRFRCAPTEIRPEGHLVRGTVHDENAEWLQGMPGHAGAFSTARDLARFCQMVVGRGMLEGRRFFQEESIEMSLRCWAPAGCSRRGLLWNATQLHPGSDQLLYYHTGFTGVGLWVEPCTASYAILLTNIVHPKRPSSPELMRGVRDGFRGLCW